MTAMHHRVAVLMVLVALRASAQSPGRLDLVRCAPASDAACLQVSGIEGAARQVIAVGADGVVGLGRGTMQRRLMVKLRSDSVVQVMAWRPPLLAMPAFRGVADSTLLPAAVRDALVAGSFGGTDRPVIALLLASLVGMAWLGVGQLGRHDDAPANSPGKDGTTRTALPGSPGDEAPPRSPDDVTRQTARRTALGR